VDPEGNLAPAASRHRTSSGGLSPSPRDSPSLPGDAAAVRDGSKKAQLLGKVSLFSKAVSAKVDQAKDKADSLKYAGTLNKKRCFTLLVIASPSVDWQRWFRGKKIHTDWDIRVEQCQFRDLALTSSSQEGTVTGVVGYKGGSRTVSALQPDFILIRQDPRDAGEDYKSVILGLQYGQLPSINSLQSIYNFQDKPWVYAHLLGLQKKLGKENFPLIEQTFYQNHRDIVHKGDYPCVFKIGHAHGGLGKVKVDTAEAFQDLAGVVAVSAQYCTVEQYVDTYCDLHIYKIGTKYKALMRKSLSEGWKSNVGDAEIEEVPVQDKHKVWIDEVAALFGGLQLCSLEAVVDSAGKEYIIEVNDCAMGLMGEGQDDDRKNIADLVISEMESRCKPPKPEKPPPPSSEAGSSRPESVLSNAEVGERRKDSEAESGMKDGQGKEAKNKEKEVPMKETEKPKRDKKEKSEEKAKKEARRAEKEAKRERERRIAEEEEKIRREKEERMKAEEEKRKSEEERKKKLMREESEESEPSVISRQQTQDSEDSESDSDSASLSSNASSTIVKKTEKGSVAKPKIKPAFNDLK